MRWAAGVVLAAFIPSISLAGADDDAKATILKKLRDPESARFTEIFATSEAVCGLVNAKNQFGGYAGPRRFYYLPADKLGFIERGGDISMDMLDQMAQGYSKFCR